MMGLDKIPDRLRKRRQWVVWREEARQGRRTKVPYTPSGRHARSNDPRTWSSFEQAVSAQRRDGYDGVGFVFAADDGLTGIDFDHCADDGQLAPWAREIVEAIDSYTEWSPSGEGLHVILRGRLPPGGRRRGSVELYDELRYFTMTGQVLPGYETVEARQEALERLHRRIFSRKRRRRPERPRRRGDGLDEASILRRAMGAANGDTFARLFAGDSSGYDSQSEADFALCMLLAFWTGGDASQMDELFRRSGLHREKWDQRHYADGRTYGEGTIANAIRAQDAFYQPGQRPGARAKGPAEAVDAAAGPGGEEDEEEAGGAIDLPQPNLAGDWLPLVRVKAALERGETGDGELLAALYRERLVYDHAEGRWYLWSGDHWEPDRTDQVSNLVAYQVASQYLSAAGELQRRGEKELAANMTKRAGKLCQRHRIKNALRRARAQPSMALTGDEWDADPWRLGVGNGVVDLRTGTCQSGQPSRYVRKASPTRWEGLEAPAPRWERFLVEIFAGDRELIGFVQRLLGYGLTGLAVEHVLPVMWGEGRNGKGTLLETVGAVLGRELASPTEASALMAARRVHSGGPQPFLYALRGMRIVWASELNEGQVMNVGLVKRLTGGDTITCRTLHSKPVTFSPSYLIILLTNNRPHVVAEDPAIWDRLRLIEFTQRFVDEPRRKNEHRKEKYLMERLREEAPGILAWLVRGCLAWQRRGGLFAPDSVTEATEDYRREEDILGQFLEDCTIPKQEAKTRAKALYRAYVQWCQENGITPRSNHTFGKKIKRFYLQDSRDKHGVYYKDIGLVAAEGIRR